MPPIIFVILLILILVKALELKVRIKVGLIEEVDCVQTKANTEDQSKGLCYIAAIRFYARHMVFKGLDTKKRQKYRIRQSLSQIEDKECSQIVTRYNSLQLTSQLVSKDHSLMLIMV